MSTFPRVALFCETFQEINGVALTARQLVDFARRKSRPLLAVLSGDRVQTFREGSVTRMELPRSWASFGIESDLRYDLFLWRHLREARAALRAFAPDVIHITSPGEFGQLGAYLAHTLRIPLVASWHTNLHQFAGRRLGKLLEMLPQNWSSAGAAWAERAALRPILRFYRIARATLAPTEDQVRWLERALGRPSFIMPRGVDCELFHPSRRSVNDQTLRIGYVGRVTPEKGVRLLADVEQALLGAGFSDFRILVVGDGSEMPWLRSHLRHGEFAGVLRGVEVARAFANMDLFAFPSRTDTFGNVVQEAAASGVASVVTSKGGPKRLVLPGVTGLVADSQGDFVQGVVGLAANRERLAQMGVAARKHAEGASWDAAFEKTYLAYRYCQHPDAGGASLANQSTGSAAA